MYQHILTAFHLAREDTMTWSLRLSFTSLLETILTQFLYWVCINVHLCVYIYPYIYIYIYSKYGVEQQQEIKSGPGIGHAFGCPFW